MRPDGCILDFDGTLFDTMPIWDTAGEDYLRRLGCTPEPALCRKLAPLSLLQAAQYLQRTYALPLGTEQILEGIHQTVADFYRYVAQPKAWTQTLLPALRSMGIPLCIATATDRSLITAALTRCGMADLFSGIFTCPEVGSGKDTPAVFEAALAFLGTRKSRTPVFEDALHAAHTASRAGFPVVAVYDPSEPQQQALEALCTWRLDTFQAELN